MLFQGNHKNISVEKNSSEIQSMNSSKVFLSREGGFLVESVVNGKM
jgi:hypothetical protein